MRTSGAITSGDEARRRVLAHKPADPSERGLAVEAEESRVCVEDAVSRSREPGDELLRPLKPEAPVDDGRAEQIEPLGERYRRGASNVLAVQAP